VTKRNGRPGFALAMPPLAQRDGRISDPTGTQFADVAVNDSEQPRACVITEQYAAQDLCATRY